MTHPIILLKVDDTVLLEMKNITKIFPGVKALDNVSFELKRGEVHALCGENGAGKSTLLKILTGMYTNYEGEIIYKNRVINLTSIQDAKARGIGVIPQEIQMVPKLSVSENILMSKYPTKWRYFIDWKKMKKQTCDIEGKVLGNTFYMDENALVENFNMGHKQLIEIMKSLSTEVDILAFDEPTSSLSDDEVERLFQLIKDLKSTGIAIIYVSHRLNEIFQICDRITVLKDGKYIDTKYIKDIEMHDVIRMMVGRNMELFDKRFYHNNKLKSNDYALSVENLSADNGIKEINFNLRKGEILGLFGIIGSGRTETARVLFGLEPKVKGIVKIDGEVVEINNPSEAVKNGMGFVTEDRHGEGLSLRAPIRWNITMPFIKAIRRILFINKQEEMDCSQSYIHKMKIKTPSDYVLAQNLSGGNQQKIVIAKWLGAESEILIFDEPTRGIDVGAKSEIYKLIVNLASEGKSIIMISSELPEILALSDRILVYKDGEISAEFENTEDLSEEDILNRAIIT